MQRTSALVAGALLVLVVAPGCSRGDRATPAAAPVPFVAVDTTTASATDRAIGVAQDRLRTEPNDRKARLALAQAFLQKARETADPTLYVKADALLGSLPDDDPGALIARGVLALARHQFDDGLRLGRAALAVAPGNEAALG